MTLPTPGGWNRLLLRYRTPLKVVGVAAAVLAFGAVAYWVQQQYAEREARWAEAVNVSGRQRMLTRQAALLGVELSVAASPTERDSLRTEFRSTIEELAAAERGLVQGRWAPSRDELDSDTLRNVLAAGGHLQRHLASYLSAARTVASLPDSSLDPSAPVLHELRRESVRLVGDFDRQTELYTRAANRTLASFRRGALAVFGLTVAGIVGLGVFVVLPQLRRLDEKAQEEFGRLFEAVPDAVLAVDEDGAVRVANRQAEEVLGYEPADLEGRSVQELVPEAARPQHTEHMRRYLQDPEPRPMGMGLDLYAIRADGEEIPVDITLNPTEINGQTLVLTGIRDLSQRQEAEEARRRAEVRYRNLFLHASDGLLVVGREGRVRSANPAAEELCGAQPGSLEDRRIRALFADDRIWASLGRTLVEEGRVDRFEARVKTLGGEIRHVEIMGIGRTETNEELAECQLLLRDVTRRKREVEKLEEQALRDPLTGIGNRRQFDDRLEHALDRARRTGEALTVVLLDVDNLKPINDRHGHPAGDEVLREVARRLENRLRDEDTVARIGGDEFAMLLERTESTNWLRDRLLTCFEAPVELSEGEIQVGASIGVSRLPPGRAAVEAGVEDGVDAEALMRAADRAVYRAKEQEGTILEVGTVGENRVTA